VVEARGLIAPQSNQERGNMDREELVAILRDTPVRIRTNDGREYDVLGREFATVSDIAASVLYRHTDGKLRHVYLPLVTMCAVEPLVNGA
jgi:hypothetical protein